MPDQSRWMRYLDMQTTSSEWAKLVPSHWTMVPLKHLVNVCSGNTPSKARLDFWNGEIPWASSKDLKLDVLPDTEDHLTELALSEGGAVVVPTGSVLSVVRGMILAHTFPVCVAGRPMAINQDLKAFSAKNGLDKDYLPWLLRGAAKAVLARTEEAGHGTKALRMDKLMRLELPLPPVAEQRSIAEFLCSELPRIDLLMAKQERLIDLLTEKITSIVTHAITQGDVNRIRLAHACTVISRPVYDEAQESYVKLGLFNRGRGIFKRESTDADDMGDSRFFWVREGDLVLSGQFAWEGAVALADEEHDGCVVSHRFPVIRGQEGIAKTEYLLALLLTKYGDFLLNEHSRGAAGRNRPLNMTSLLKVKIPLISTDKQNEVAALMHLRKRITEKIASQTQLLREHRASLISAVVTGKIRVIEDVETPEDMAAA